VHGFLLLADLQAHMAFHRKSWQEVFRKFWLSQRCLLGIPQKFIQHTANTLQGEGTQPMKALKATGEMQGRLSEMMFVSWCKGSFRMRVGLWLLTWCWVWWRMCEKISWGWMTWLFSLSSLPLEKQGMWFKSEVYFLLSSMLQKCCMVFATSGKWGRSPLHYSHLGKTHLLQKADCITWLLWLVVTYYGQKGIISRVQYAEIFCDSFTVSLSKCGGGRPLCTKMCRRICVSATCCYLMCIYERCDQSPSLKLVNGGRTYEDSYLKTWYPESMAFCYSSYAFLLLVGKEEFIVVCFTVFRYFFFFVHFSFFCCFYTP